MENLMINKDDFYKLTKKIFDDNYDKVEIEKLPGRKERYKKVDNDYYKCKVEYCCLRDEDDNIMFISEKPVSGIKHTGCFVEEQKTFDPSTLSLEEIKEIVNDNKEEYPFTTGIPSLIKNISKKKKNDKVLKLDDELINLAVEIYKEYLFAIKDGKVRKLG